MASQNKLSQSQINALLTFQPLIQSCRKSVDEVIAAYPSLARVRKVYFGDLDIVCANLISRKITIGEANLLKSKYMQRLSDETNAEYARYRAEYLGQIDQIRNQEYQQQAQQQAQQDAANERARIAAANYLQSMSNQKAVQAQTYQNQAVPPGYSPNNSNPFYSTPQQPIQQPRVNCNPNGLGGYSCR
jgi:selenocysteine-specific translation elongation factor